MHDINIGSVVRTANAFNAAGVHIVGRRRWNRRGAMVTDAYLHRHHHPDVASLAGLGPRSRPGGARVDNLPGAVPLETYAATPARACCSSARRGLGCREQARAACQAVLSIAQFGSTRSINAGAAAAIAMHAWVREHAASP